MRFLSLFSGIEAASCAWVPLSWECVGVAEIERFPSAVLAHHYPDVPNLGDITQVTETQIKALGHVDLVVGGFPCQDLSVAGKRKGLRNDDGSVTRSGLFFDAMRIVRWSGARYVLLENVPGIYSSNRGRDFAAVVGEILGVEFGVPPNGWENTGVAASERGLLEWATLDAQWFGVAQRRRRMFALADFGDWRDRGPVLFERHSLSGHPAPRRETGEGIAKCLTRGAAQRLDSETETMIPVTHSLRGEGFDASEDGTGRGTPLVPVAFNLRGREDGAQPEPDPDNIASMRAASGGSSRSYIAFAENSRSEVRLEGGDGSRVGALSTGGGKPGQGAPMIAFTAKDHGADALEDCSPTLRAGGHSGSHANAGVMPAVAFRTVAGAITSNYGKQPDNSDTGLGPNLAANGMAVRRLTPVECERLQGFHDGYTDIRPKGKPTPDGPRYKALGNSMAVPVMTWIGQRIAAVSNIL